MNNVDAELFDIFKSLNLSKESISIIADELIALFDLEEKTYKNQIINSLMSLTYKDKLLRLVNSLKYIIEVTEVKKGSFYKILNIVISHLKQNEISNSLQFSARVLQTYSIDIFNEEDNSIKLLIKIYEFPEIIQFLLGNNLDSKFREVFEEKDKISQMEDFELIRAIKEEINGQKKGSFNISDCVKILDEVDNLSDIKSKVI